jgi:hypothetical protein
MGLHTFYCINPKVDARYRSKVCSDFYLVEANLIAGTYAISFTVLVGIKQTWLPNIWYKELEADTHADLQKN